jgi:glucokinase
VTPRRIVIGGGVAAAGELILDPIRRSMRDRVFLVDTRQVEVVLAQLGNNAGLIGAALWARETIT